jgi:hypothetical protein
VRYNAKVSSHWISILESKVLSRLEEFGTGSYSGGGEQKFPNQTPESQKIPNFASNSMT